VRVGEVGGLRDDAMYRLGDTWWLRIPLASCTTNAPSHSTRCSSG